MKEIIPELISIILEAGDAVLEIYKTDFKTEIKEDSSPVTKADIDSNRIIVSRLEKVKVPGYDLFLPVLSEESMQISYEERKKWDAFWLVDPLDGTKEFISGNGEFTVNIALIKNNRPVFGIIYAPVLDTVYYGISGEGAYKCTGKRKMPEKIITAEERCFINQNGHTVINKIPEIIKVLTSRSHISSECGIFINNLKQQGIKVQTITAGSSLKFCLLAESVADIYLRFGTTMEWDTAAGHAIVNSSGRRVYKYSSPDELVYNKEDLRNPGFIAY